MYFSESPSLVISVPVVRNYSFPIIVPKFVIKCQSEDDVDLHIFEVGRIK